MARISDRAIAGAVVLGGLAPANDKENIAFWVAVALAESSGITDNVSWTRCCVGLWQVNSAVWVGEISNAPTNNAEFRQWLNEPLNNARAAAHINRTQGRTAWTVYTNGRYRNFLSRGRAAAENPDVSSVAMSAGQDASFGESLGAVADLLTPEPLDQIAETIGEVGEIVSDTARWLGDPNNWLRIVQVVGGIVLGVVAATIVAKPVIKDVKRTVSPV